MTFLCIFNKMIAATYHMFNHICIEWMDYFHQLEHKNDSVVAEKTFCCPPETELVPRFDEQKIRL